MPSKVYAYAMDASMVKNGSSQEPVETNANNYSTRYYTGIKNISQEPV